MYLIVCTKEKDALNGTNFTTVHLCSQNRTSTVILHPLYYHYCGSVIFVIAVNTCAFRRSVDNRGSSLSIYTEINLVPRALFPGFPFPSPPPKPGKSALGTRLYGDVPLDRVWVLSSLS